ncbi:MAG: dihydrofolate reductase [Bacteroidales bacterium]|jgi:dihydrofolate reductase|nr:dihydrofolate reductase [Bacteroidales bacterium]
MIVSAIAAVSENNVIGNNNDLIWHMPADLRFFKQKTTGHVMIMGRKTFESMNNGKPLPNRTTIIVTRNKDYSAPEGVLIAHSIEEALALTASEHECFICGGAEIYKAFLPFTDYLYITRIHHSFDGDTFFPKFCEINWKIIFEEHHSANEKNKYDHTFITYKKTY